MDELCNVEKFDYQMRVGPPGALSYEDQIRCVCN